MRAKRLRSGPTANGKIAASTRKKTNPVEVPPPLRRAMPSSRQNSAARADLTLLPQRQLPRIRQIERAMRRSDDHAALAEMVVHQMREPRLRGRVQRVQRLVEQPDRPRRDEQPRQRHAAFLAGG